VVRLALAFGADARDLIEPVIAHAVANSPTAPAGIR
jgi:hypothetical protein